MKRIFIGLMVFFVIPLQLSAQFDNCLADWLFYKEIMIDNSVNNTDLEDFQFKFTVNTGALVDEAKLQIDGADLRFVTENCELLHYYMDSTANNIDNVIWLRMPFLAANSQQTIRMYYGNPNAEAYANGDSTFLFFDDFEGPEVDTNKWETVGEFATFEVANGLLDYASTNANPGPRFKFARTKVSWTGEVDLDFRAQIGTSQAFGFSSADSLIERYYFRYQNGAQSNDTLNLIAILGDTISNGYAVEVNYPLLNISKNSLTHLSIRPRINSDNKLIVDQFQNVETGQTNTEMKDLGPFLMNAYHFVISSFGPSWHVYLDYFRVRKILDTMPSAAIGMEMMNPFSTSTERLSFEGIFQISPNPASDWLQIHYQGEKLANVHFFNAKGQLIKVIKLDQLVMKPIIDLSELETGWYFISLKDQSSGQILSHHKIFIQ